MVFCAPVLKIHKVQEAAMMKILLVIGALCSMTVTRTDGTVTLPSQSFKIQQGRDFRISCEVIGEDFVHWQTPSKPARPGVPAVPSVNIPETTTTGPKHITVSGNTYQLVVQDVAVKDGGDYVCQGAVNSATITLEVDFEIGGVQAKQTLNIGEKGVIELNVPAFPPPTYEWVKDGKELTFPDPSGRRSLDAYTGSIIITQVQKSDEGNYTCTVSRLDSTDIEVTVFEKPKINKASGNPVTRVLTQGYNVTFTCDVESGYPEPRVEWWFDWSGKNKEVEVVHYPRYTHPTPKTWLITNIQEDDKGKYRCIAVNEAGEDVQLFHITEVFVPPKIDPMQDIIANEGSRVELTCSVTGDPVPSVEWFHQGIYYTGQTPSKDVPNNKIVSKIVFEKVQVQNFGNYTCKARNGASDPTTGTVIEEEKTIELLVRSMPKINIPDSPTPVYSFVGRRFPVQVMCKFFGYPVPTVKMFSENGTEIASGNQSVSINITTLSEDDFGIFNCTAENAQGTAEYLVELKQAVPPGPPQDVSAEKTCDSITLKWQEPAENGGMPIINYIVTVFFSNGTRSLTKNVAGSVRMEEINSQSETTYNLHLKARSEAGQGKEEILLVTTNKFCVPGKPTITNTETNVDVNFIVTWRKPDEDGGDPNLKYRLEWRKQPIDDNTEVGKEENIKETRFKITGLEYESEYEVKLFAVNSEGDSEADTKDFKTIQSPGTIAALVNKLGPGAIAGIVIAIILIVLIVIDLFCCFFNNCGVFFCCQQALCGGGGGAEKKGDYMDGKATEMEKKPITEKV